MHVEQNIKQGVSQVAAMLVRLKEFALRRKRAAIALLVIGPLMMTGDVQVFVLNGIGLAIAGSVIEARGELDRGEAWRLGERGEIRPAGYPCPLPGAGYRHAAAHSHAVRRAVTGASVTISTRFRSSFAKARQSATSAMLS